MKIIFWIIVLIIFTVVLAKVSHYSERMATYNAHSCAVLGYEPDCKTRLEEGD